MSLVLPVCAFLFTYPLPPVYLMFSSVLSAINWIDTTPTTDYYCRLMSLLIIVHCHLFLSVVWDFIFPTLARLHPVKFWLSLKISAHSYYNEHKHHFQPQKQPCHHPPASARYSVPSHHYWGWSALLPHLLGGGGVGSLCCLCGLIPANNLPPQHLIPSTKGPGRTGGRQCQFTCLGVISVWSFEVFLVQIDINKYFHTWFEPLRLSWIYK